MKYHWSGLGFTIAVGLFVAQMLGCDGRTQPNPSGAQAAPALLSPAATSAESEQQGPHLLLPNYRLKPPAKPETDPIAARPGVSKS